MAEWQNGSFCQTPEAVPIIPTPLLPVSREHDPISRLLDNGGSESACSEGPIILETRALPAAECTSLTPIGRIICGFRRELW
jgi:hypothetical protein